MTIHAVIDSFPPDLHEPVRSLYECLARDMGVSREDFRELHDTVRLLTHSQAELAGAQNRTEKRVKELTVAQNRTEDKLQLLADELREGFLKVNEQFSALGSRWGLQTESALRKAVEAILQDTGHTVTRGYYGQREVDLVVRNGTHILLEIMSRLKSDDVDKLLRSAVDYEQREGVRPNLIIAASYIGPEAMQRLLDSRLPIRFFSGEEDEVLV